MHHMRDVDIFRARETLDSIMAGIYDFKGEGRSQEPRPK